MGAYNPLRYRGYVYDVETGLYYLQSRYYDPEWGRFINADGFVSTGQGLTGNNMFAYCGNNPVVYTDPAGTLRMYNVQMTDTGGRYARLCGEATPPNKSYDDFLEALAMSESSGDHGVVNQYGFQGLYQMGSPALQDAGFKNSAGEWTALANSYGVNSTESFLNNTDAQKVAVTNFHKKVCNYIRYYEMEKYIGTSYQGVTVTHSGLLAACHLVGAQTMAEALKNGSMVRDGNGTSAVYYISIFAGYHISEVWD